MIVFRLRCSHLEESLGLPHVGGNAELAHEMSVVAKFEYLWMI